MATTNFSSGTIVASAWLNDVDAAVYEQIPYATPHPFGSDIIPTKHLKQFSCRFAGNGTGAVPGAVTCAAGAVTAIALGDAGANYSTTTARVLITGDGTGATAEISGVGGSGEVSGYTITAGGSGYTTATAYIVDGPVVVVTGDSIATEQPDPSNLGASQWHLLKSAIAAQNPERNITFFNRAIGSETFTTFDTEASGTLPDWYVNPTKLWLDYIEELQPDLIVVAFGMNDRENLVFSRVNSSFATMQAMVPQPDIVYITPMVPSAISSTTSISSAEAQNGRDAAAGYVRGLALKENLGFVDLNRRLRLVRDGQDVRHCALREIESGVSALPWIAHTASEGDFSLDLTFTTFVLAGNTLTFYLGTTGANTRTELLISDDGGKVKILVRDIQPTNLSTTTQWEVTTPLATPTGTVQIQVVAQDQRLTVLVEGTMIFSEQIKRFSGKFYPYVSYTAAESPTIIYCAGEYGRYITRMQDPDLWGSGPSGAYKGNGLNHPSGLAVMAVMAQAIFEADWSHSPMTIGTSATGVSTYIGIGETDPLARLHVTKRRIVNASRITPTATANTLVLEDDTAPGLSLLSGNAGVARINFGDEDDEAKFTAAYNHSTDTLTFAIGGVTQFTLTGTQITGAIPLRPYVGTKLQIAALTGVTQGAQAYCTDEAGGEQQVNYDGVQWRRVTDRAIMS